ncbi:MAG: glycosyltransferase [Muribaculaceae bacterium]|nr:glycosyltransferase [Muribaculaceae bacterium]
MKILHVITSLRTGGAEKLMVDLLPRLRDAGHEVELLLFDGVETPFKAAAKENGIRIHELGRKRSVYSPLNFFRLLPYLRRYDIVHTHNTAPQLFAAIGSLFCRTRLFTTEHGGSNRRRSWKWYARLDRWMYSRYEKVVCISDKGEENLRAFIGDGENICTINNGVDVEKFSSASSSGELERMAPRSRKIVMVAGFRWEKDQPTVIKALSHLPENFHLFLIGDGVRCGEFASLTAELGLSERVHFLGVRSDVAELLHAADYVVMSSHFEGLSLSSVEGMSVGKPFIASDVDGLREVVKGYGILFPHEDSEALAAEIMRLEDSEERYKSVADTCRRRADKFDIAQMAEAYSRIYNQSI